MKGKAVNIQNLNRGHFAEFSSRLGNAYQQIAGGSDYKKNSRDLRVIQWAVVTVKVTS